MCDLSRNLDLLRVDYLDGKTASLCSLPDDTREADSERMCFGSADRGVVLCEAATMALEACLGRKYKLEKNENFEEFLKAFGVGYLIRKMAQLASPVIELTRDGDTYTFTSTSTFKSTVLKFKLGEEFEEERHDGALVKSVITLQDDSTLLHQQHGDKEATITRHFTPEQVTITMQVGDVKCTKIFKAI